MNTNIIKIFSIKDWECILILFFYIFSFYIIGPITSTMIVIIPIIMYNFKKNVLFKLDKYALNIIYFLIFLIFVGLIYSVLHLTFDLSYIKVLIGQLIQIIAGIIIVRYLRDKYKITSCDIEKYIIYAYILQSIIEIIASVTPSFATALLPFNRAYNFQDGDAGRRGLALSSGTGWSLGLSFGIVYIIYVKRFLLNGINFLKVIIGVLLLVGTMFAGRTGFVGAAFSFILFLLNVNKSFLYKLFFVIKVLFLVILTCFLFYLIFPDVTEHLINVVFPFAFEPFYALYYNQEFSTKSTDKLQEMWNVVITPIEVLIGTGHFTNSTGSYYKHIDIGILRNLFYWGILGYFLIITYQIFMIRPLKYIGDDYKVRWNTLIYKLCMIFYLCLMEYKAMTVGFNKMAISIIFLLGYSYYLDNKKESQIVHS